MLNKIKKFINEHFESLLTILICLFIACLTMYISTNKLDVVPKDNNDDVVNMTPKQAQDENYVQNKLDTTKDEAKVIVVEVGKAQTNQIPPSTTVTINSTSPQEATKEITERIEKKDPTLPKEAIEDTDKTIVAEQPENEEYKVGVYKINTYKNWGVGFGIGKVDGTEYIPIAIERQYAHNKSLEFQVNYNIDKHKIDGGQIMHKWHF